MSDSSIPTPVSDPNAELKKALGETHLPIPSDSVSPPSEAEGANEDQKPDPEDEVQDSDLNPASDPSEAAHRAERGSQPAGRAGGIGIPSIPLGAMLATAGKGVVATGKGAKRGYDSLGERIQAKAQSNLQEKIGSIQAKRAKLLHQIEDQNTTWQQWSDFRQARVNSSELKAKFENKSDREKQALAETEKKFPELAKIKEKANGAGMVLATVEDLKTDLLALQDHAKAIKAAGPEIAPQLNDIYASLDDEIAPKVENMATVTEDDQRALQERMKSALEELHEKLKEIFEEIMQFFSKAKPG